MKKSIRIISYSVIIVFIILAFLIITKFMTKDKYTITEIKESYELRINVPFKVRPNSPVQITLSSIDKENGRCSLTIDDLPLGTSKDGEVGVGEYVSFALEEVGRRGLQLNKISDDAAVFTFYHSEIE